jgi:hypothetical protein
MTDLLVRALRVVEAARAERATGDHLGCAFAPCGLCASLAAFDAPEDEPEVQPLGEFPPLDDQCPIIGGFHVWNDAGRCSRCDNWKEPR